MTILEQHRRADWIFDERAKGTAEDTRPQIWKEFQVKNPKMKSIFTFLAFILACSILLSSFEEAEGVGYILELTRPTRKSRSSSKNGKGKRNLKQSKKANRQLKRQMKKVMRSLRKTQQKEAILRRMLHTVSLYKRTFFKIGICTFMKKIK